MTYMRVERASRFLKQQFSAVEDIYVVRARFPSRGNDSQLELERNPRRVSFSERSESEIEDMMALWSC